MPEYVVYIREKGGADQDWKFVGSLAVPRTLKVDEVIFENEEGLVKVSQWMRERERERDTAVDGVIVLCFYFRGERMCVGLVHGWVE